MRVFFYRLVSLLATSLVPLVGLGVFVVFWAASCAIVAVAQVWFLLVPLLLIVIPCAAVYLLNGFGKPRS